MKIPRVGVDVLDAMPHTFTLVADVRLRNVWRARLGFLVISIGVRLLRSRFKLESVEDAAKT